VTSGPDDQREPLPRTVRVARSALLRVASWPLPTLDALACPDLWEAARQDEPDYPERYEAAMAAQRDQLRAITTTSAFDRALTIANPVVAERWRRGGGRARSGKSRDRRLEATVVRFVCRAAGRPTPNGAWAGVAAVGAADDGEAELGTGLRVQPAQGRWWVSPSLLPFHELCGWLVRTEEYLRAGHFDLDSTLHHRSGRWVLYNGRAWRRLPDRPFVDHLVAWFEAHETSGALPLAPFVDAVSDAADARTMLWEALRGLRDVGVLVPALRIPLGGDPATVLGQLSTVLPPSVRDPWMSAVEGLGALCNAVSDEFEQLDGTQLGRHGESARAILVALWRAVGAPGSPPAGSPALRVDRGAPFRAAWSCAARRTVADALTELIDVWAADGTAERYRQRHVSFIEDGPLLEQLWRWASPVPAGADASEAARAEHADPSGPFTRAGVFAMHFGTREDLPVEERWAALPVADDTVVARPGALQGPWSAPAGDLPRCGAHLVVLDGDQVHLEWGRPQPALFCGRHVHLPVAAEVVREFADALARDGLEVVDVTARDLLALDAAVRDHHGRRLDLTDRASVRTLTVGSSDGASGVTVAGQDGRRLFPTSHSAAGSAGLDPLSRLGAELCNANGWELLSFGLPLTSRELAGGGVPAVVTPSGHVLRRRRLVAGTAWVEHVSTLEPVERFAEWVALLANASLPPRVTVHVGTQPPLLLPANSPLCVEALFASLPRPVRPLVLAEPPPTAIVTDDAGRQYTAELAVSWWRT
jgi:hypothetical protein